MNKRGDLPVTLLVIGVFAICTLALITFILSSNQVSKSFVGINVMEKANAQIEEENMEHLYVEEKINEFSPEWSLDWFKEKVIFSVEYNP